MTAFGVLSKSNGVWDIDPFQGEDAEDKAIHRALTLAISSKDYSDIYVVQFIAKAIRKAEIETI